MKKIFVTFLFIAISFCSCFANFITVTAIDIWEDGTVFIRGTEVINTVTTARVYFLPNNSLIKKEAIAAVLYAKQNSLAIESTLYPASSNGYFQLQSVRVNF